MCCVWLCIVRASCARLYEHSSVHMGIKVCALVRRLAATAVAGWYVYQVCGQRYAL